MTNTQTQDVRSAILGAQPEKRDIIFFGQKVTVKQPSMGTTLSINAGVPEGPTRNAIIQSKMIIAFTVATDTGEPVFEDTDVDSIMGLPFSDDMQRIAAAINDLTGTDIEKTVKNSTPIPEA